MTEEEKAEIYVNVYGVKDKDRSFVKTIFKDGFKDGFREGQKENAELKKDLQTAIDANQKWLRRDTELEAQIEKMKCCGNCEYGKGIMCSHDKRCMGNYENWELINES